MKVPFVNLAAQCEPLKSEFSQALDRVCASGAYILGKEVEQFEQSLADVCQTKFVVTVANGTDALVLALKVLDIGPGDEVITAPNSFIASAGAIAAVGAEIRFADVLSDYNISPAAIEAAITEKTKAIIPVHLTGNPVDMDAIDQIAKRHNLKVIEDAAQAIDAQYKGRKVGSLGDLACFSLHPLKNFHLMGDAGFISTDDPSLAKRLLRLRNHGLINRDESVEWGLNSRLDALQAAWGNIKLPYLPQWTERFRQIARQYTAQLTGVVECPRVRKDDQAVFHNYVIQVENRTQLMAYLADNGIESKIHYPIPLHMMQAAKGLGYGKGSFPCVEEQSKRIMSLPIYPELTDEQVSYVCEKIIEFYKH